MFAVDGRYRALFALCALCALAPGCSETTSAAPEPVAESASPFLGPCGDGCVEGLECLCGVCTRYCQDDASCAALSELAVCGWAAGNGCGSDGPPPTVCRVNCDDDADCEVGQPALSCQGGSCRPEVPGADGG